jgi:hypothetical protein
MDTHFSAMDTHIGPMDVSIVTMWPRFSGLTYPAGGRRTAFQPVSEYSRHPYASPYLRWPVLSAGLLDELTQSVPVRDARLEVGDLPLLVDHQEGGKGEDA